jgi:hypothetical protein
MVDVANKGQGGGAALRHPVHNNVTYEIRVTNHLDPCWQQWFDGWSLTNLGNGEVSLRRSNVDQSALHGALNKIRDLNLTLLSVSRMEKE